MEILLQRVAKKDKYTIGKLYINNLYFCDTLEDTDRGLTLSMTEQLIKSNKVYGETAIPTGIYRIVISYSNRFKKLMPLLLNVPGFSGIRIHTGNTEKDSLGCILVGKNKAIGKVLESRDTYNKLFSILQKANEKEIIKITIK
ncbi:putative transpeptidase [uncultured phage cr130_1]|uniref:Transpeptidase n=1 Tax=uncultured phage cr130_1 TaxID=2772092 RepID=A0A7M1RT74_9CAUD|nr:putative transpeptidase [uncultured phage cr130_1]QOR57635.1 putative transpeptidase [uncultured phage cr130_1]